RGWLGLQMGQELRRHPNRPVQIDLDLAGELLEIAPGAVEIDSPHDARAVDQYARFGEFPGDPSVEGFHLLGVGDVALDGAQARQGLLCFLQLARVPARDDDPVAARVELPGQLPADAAPSTGDEDRMIR